MPDKDPGKIPATSPEKERREKAGLATAAAVAGGRATSPQRWVPPFPYSSTRSGQPVPDDDSDKLPDDDPGKRPDGNPGKLPATSPPKGPANLPASFPAFHVTQNANEIGAYLANASYVISLGGPPLADLKYGIIVLPVGEESLLLGPQPQGSLFTQEFHDAIQDANHARSIQVELHGSGHDSAEFLRPRFEDDFPERPLESHYNVEAVVQPQPQPQQPDDTEDANHSRSIQVELHVAGAQPQPLQLDYTEICPSIPTAQQTDAEPAADASNHHADVMEVDNHVTTARVSKRAAKSSPFVSEARMTRGRQRVTSREAALALEATQEEKQEAPATPPRRASGRNLRKVQKPQGVAKSGGRNSLANGRAAKP